MYLGYKSNSTNSTNSTIMLHPQRKTSKKIPILKKVEEGVEVWSKAQCTLPFCKLYYIKPDSRKGEPSPGFTEDN